MSGKVDYGKFFHVINCGLYIFFEDDFTVNNPTKEKVIYSFSRMDLNSRNTFLLEVKELSPSLFEQLSAYISVFDLSFSAITDWENEVAKDDITTAFEIIKTDNSLSPYYESLLQSYEKIDLSNFEVYSAIFRKYGLGINIPSYFESMFDECIRHSSRWEAFRIYTDFNSKTLLSVKDDLTKFFSNQPNNHCCATCIIDNALSGNRRADEILKELETFNANKRHNLIGAVFTSHQKLERVSESIFIEYVDKKVPEGLQTALTKSAYSYMIYKLKEESKKMLDSSFSKALSNRNIAFYLAKMAASEGIANYQVVTDWINLMYAYEMSKSDGIPHLIKLTRLIEQLDDENVVFSEDLLKLNSYEAFDFNVNKYFQPPAAGDVFSDGKGKFYILIGQDCDIMMSETRKRNNAVTELVIAEKVSQTEMDKLNSNLDFMMIGNFKEKDEDQLGCLKIRYSSRKFIDNQIINLCTFSDNGQCKINLSSPLSQEAQDIMMPYLTDYYSELQKYFRSIQTIKNSVPDEFNYIMKSDFSPRLIAIQDYMYQEDEVSFKLKRVCRITRTYVLYLYKLFLEYRGRYPFDSINLSRHQTLDITVSNLIDESIPVHIMLSPDRESNRNSLQKLPWVIERQEIKSLLDKLNYPNASIKNEDYFCLDQNPSYIDVGDGKRLELTKQKKHYICARIV